MANLNGAFYPVYKQQNSAFTSATFVCAEETVEKLLETATTSDHPGILLGKVQSGKTRTFISILALAFDNGFDIAIVLSKNSKALIEQTAKRLKSEFKWFLDDEELAIYDIMSAPDKFSSFELESKLILVAKKQSDNLRRLIALFDNDPAMSAKRTLIIDDEADSASIGYTQKQGIIEANKIAKQVSELRSSIESSSFLQVTATPYSLYLQPSEVEVVHLGEERRGFIDRRQHSGAGGAVRRDGRLVHNVLERYHLIGLVHFVDRLVAGEERDFERLRRNFHFLEADLLALEGKDGGIDRTVYLVFGQRGTSERSQPHMGAVADRDRLGAAVIVAPERKVVVAGGHLVEADDRVTVHRRVLAGIAVLVHQHDAVCDALFARRSRKDPLQRKQVIARVREGVHLHAGRAVTVLEDHRRGGQVFESPGSNHGADGLVRDRVHAVHPEVVVAVCAERLAQVEAIEQADELVHQRERVADRVRRLGVEHIAAEQADGLALHGQIANEGDLGHDLLAVSLRPAVRLDQNASRRPSG